jgi:hypothetical protein
MKYLSDTRMARVREELLEAGGTGETVREVASAGASAISGISAPATANGMASCLRKR